MTKPITDKNGTMIDFAVGSLGRDGYVKVCRFSEKMAFPAQATQKERVKICDAWIRGYRRQTKRLLVTAISVEMDYFILSRLLSKAAFAMLQASIVQGVKKHIEEGEEK